MIVDDELLDMIAAAAYFAPGGKWCRLYNYPCLSFPSCDEYIVDGHCRFGAESAMMPC